MENTNQSTNEAIVHDTFCYRCHKKCNERCMKKNCSKCFRTFHETCLKNTDENNGSNSVVWRCGVCVSLQRSKTNFENKGWILDLLKHLMEKIYRDPMAKVLKRLDKIDVTYSIDLHEINEKIEAQRYDSLNAFLEDIRIIAHNCCCTGKYIAEVKDLVEVCETEIENILGCAECYQNMHTQSNWWTTVCGRPHLVLWVKFKRNLDYWPAKKGYECWPAKLVSSGRKRSDVKVIFLDGSGFFDIPKANCYTYSTKTPEMTRDIIDVLKMVNLYGQNISDKFGKFQVGEKSIKLGDKLIEEHIQDMFPDYDQKSQNIQETDRYWYGPVMLWNDGSNDSDGLDDTHETPKKRRRISGQSTRSPFSCTSSSSGLFDLTFDQNLQPSELAQKFENLQSHIMQNAHTLNSTIQTLSDNFEKSLADAQVKNSKHISDLEAKLQKANLEMTTMKEQHENALRENGIIIDSLKKDKENLQNWCEQNNAAIINLKKKMKRNHDKEMEDLKIEHCKEVIELENQVKSVVEQRANDETQRMQDFGRFRDKLGQKYAELGKKYEEMKKCYLCKKSNAKLFCGAECAEIWINPVSSNQSNTGNSTPD